MAGRHRRRGCIRPAARRSPSSYAHLAVFAGLIAANLPDGSEVPTATGDVTSILFPFYAQSGRGIRVREVPLDRIENA